MLYFKSCRHILQLSANRLGLNSLIPRHLVLIRQGVTLNGKGNFEGEQTAYDIQEQPGVGATNTTNQRTSFPVFSLTNFERANF